jgi:hypothetical protein
LASSFAITTPSNSVTLNAAGNAAASFTVSNETTRVIRARASAVAVDLTKHEWLSMTSEPERSFSPGGTEQFAIGLAVPHDAPAGTYRFRLDVVSVTAPDDDWAHGPEVSFAVADRPPPPPKPGYVETLVGSLMGALAGGLLGTALGIVLAIIASNKPSTGDALGDIVSAIVTLVIVLALLGFLGVWLGTALGAYTGLRLLAFPVPLHTALLVGVLFPVTAIVMVIVLALLLNLVHVLPGIVGLVITLLCAAAAVTGAALAGRAIYRFRSTGAL